MKNKIRVTTITYTRIILKTLNKVLLNLNDCLYFLSIFLAGINFNFKFFLVFEPPNGGFVRGVRYDVGPPGPLKVPSRRPRPPGAIGCTTRVERGPATKVCPLAAVDGRDEPAARAERPEESGLTPTVAAPLSLTGGN